MKQRTLRRILTLATLPLLSATLALAQTETLPVRSISQSRYDPLSKDWAQAAAIASSWKKLIVVTSAQPTGRHSCRVKSITADRLVCKSAFSKNRIYKPQEVAALIRPGDDDLRVRLLLGLNAGLGAAIWGTIVLAPVCIPCAAATAFGAYFFLAGAWVTGYVDGRPESVLYLAPGQELQAKLH